VAARRRSLELVLRRAGSPARETNGRVGSSGAGRGARSARMAPGSSEQGGSPKRCQWRRPEPAAGKRVRARGAQGLLIAARRRLGVHTCYSRSRCGRGVVQGRCTTCGRRRPNGARRRGRPACVGAAHGTGLGLACVTPTRRAVPAARASDRRSLPCLGMRANKYDSGVDAACHDDVPARRR
jgi:hypothetical protein